MHANELAFIAAIRAAPADDQPRLIYADALQLGDGGFPADHDRGVLIRNMIALHRLAPPHEPIPDPAWVDYDREVTALRHSVNFLIGDGRDVKRGWVPDVVNLSTYYGLNGWYWRRGMIEDVTFRWNQFQRRYNDVVRQVPLRHVDLTTLPDEIVLRDMERVKSIGRQRYKNQRYPGLTFTLPADQPTDGVQEVLNSLGRMRLRDVSAHIATLPAMRVLLSHFRGHVTGTLPDWRHATTSYLIPDVDAVRSPAWLVTYIHAQRDDALRRLLGLLEDWFWAEGHDKPEDFNFVALQGAWLRETAVYSVVDRVTHVALDATYMLERRPVPGQAPAGPLPSARAQRPPRSTRLDATGV